MASGTSPPSTRRICACAAATSAVVGVLPVPIAQTGSYATTNLAAEAPAGTLPFSCVSSTVRVRPASRSASVSPMQTTGSRPVRHAASALARTMASVSPQSVRRSECPTMIWLAPASLSISAEMSPVWAPLAAAWQFWPPTRTPLPFTALAMPISSVAGGQIRTSRSVQPACFTPSATPPASARASAARPFIFQLPAISGRLDRAIRFPPGVRLAACLAAARVVVKVRLVACQWGQW